jgi:hypothetical protein
MAAPSGSARPIWIAGFLSFRKLLMPARVPPVPTAQMKPSILPPSSSQISGPVPS